MVTGILGRGHTQAIVPFFSLNDPHGLQQPNSDVDAVIGCMDTSAAAEVIGNLDASAAVEVVAHLDYVSWHGGVWEIQGFGNILVIG